MSRLQQRPAGGIQLQRHRSFSVTVAEPPADTENVAEAGTAKRPAVARTRTAEHILAKGHPAMGHPRNAH